MTPEALDSLSRQELIALVLALMEQNEALAARVAVLEARLSAPPKTPGNSSLPPSKGQKANKPEKAKKEPTFLRAGLPKLANIIFGCHADDRRAIDDLGGEDGQAAQVAEGRAVDD